ncbi:phosphoglucomutase/phosphomannomutase alpha/beta/alpha domain I [Spirochaeta thermophila DSM 6578]|uniref:Phosphoglucomutase/phosphomannomutase alpha/beta/alpha domain I n=1 Tax=Winmispira thermophila (strain ATCC 700085 / DSM 6578 / Z-1203) TaxID=869211 RepID=G0GB60_WINT7|nr:phosphoglucomutase [Spirochaeta thermophila]AEJ61084.1 phosphoglucomutase/phosphomannomutase alpha/beta/alpha domain I [Spirochaeta thermophila DSM 6578]
MAVDRLHLMSALKGYILSVSGWRKVFAASGEEQDTSPEISEADRVLAVCAGKVIGEFFRGQKQGTSLLLARDSRPTGKALCRALAAGLCMEGVGVHYAGIAAAPEVMALSAADPDLAGFVYVSASHNPVGHNGIKVGARGGVLSADEANELIRRFREEVERLGEAEAEGLLEGEAPSDLWEEEARWKDRALRAYGGFVRRVITGGEAEEEVARRWRELGEGVRRRGLVVVGELNGSARGASVDREVLEDLGCEVRLYNAEPGRFVHEILPEGESLEMCADLVRSVVEERECEVLGYVPDCDGDRGNLVYGAPGVGVRALGAQEVFALAVLGELAWLDALLPGGVQAHRVAVVCNGPTSLRVEEVAGAFGAHVVRTEVGEAHVVGKAEALRQEGWVVRVLGEGSNGGSIVHPARVRDPLATLGSVLKILALREPPYALFARWCARKGLSYHPHFTLTDVLSSLPAYLTTGTGAPEARLTIRSEDRAAFKSTYERLFLSDWELRANELHERFGITGFEEHHHEGLETHVGFGPSFRTGTQKGGLRILFKDEKGEPCAFMWMRKSGTEPVFRVMVDARAHLPGLYDYLLEWQHSLIRRADEEASRGRTRS